MSNCNIFLHITGSISAFKAASLASLLVKNGYRVRCGISEGAEHFIGKATLEGLTREPVFSDMWAGNPDFVPHITLAQNWADLLLVYPASANAIARLACGLADDLFGALYLANNFNQPVWIAPAMNSQMFAHPQVQENLAHLAKLGCTILPTGEGRMACGTIGYGRLIEPEEVFSRINDALAHGTIKLNPNVPER